MPKQSIELPVQLTKMSTRVESLAEACVAMRDCVELCVLLDNQRDVVN